jgi:hypothetical protein
MVINIMVRILLLCLVCVRVLLLGDASAQDFESLLDVAFANGECLQNYDVSYRKNTIADLPKDQERLANIKMSRASKQLPFWEEKEEIGRLVIDKESTSSPKKILFVKRTRITAEGKAANSTEFLVWDDGRIANGTTRNPSGEIAKGPCSLARCYLSHFIPSFETYNGSLSAPRTEGYWDDHSVYWEWYKSQGSGTPLVRLPNGRLRWEKTFETHRGILEYDPITSLIVFSSAIPIDQETGNEKLEMATPKRVTWENHQNVYRLKGIVSRNVLFGVVLDESESFFWHQCNEENFVFPKEFLKELSLEKCSQFLIDGQSELSNGRSK